MIKLIENFENYDFSFFENDVFFRRIYSDFCTNSMFSDSLFYVSVNENVVDAVIGKVGQVITLSSKECTPFEELNEFFSVIGYSVILCEEKFSSHFEGVKTYGDILKNTKMTECCCKAQLLYTENLKDVFGLLVRIFNLNIDFMDWFADMSHKLRHGTAKCCGIYENNKLVSVALSVFETDNSAVISSVATDERFRKKGYGEKVVKTLLDENKGKDVYVFTENENISKWYEKSGFTGYKKWSEIKNVL